MNMTALETIGRQIAELQTDAELQKVLDMLHVRQAQFDKRAMKQFKAGDLVSFMLRNGKRQVAKVVRSNKKTVTVRVATIDEGGTYIVPDYVIEQMDKFKRGLSELADMGVIPSWRVAPSALVTVEA